MPQRARIIEAVNFIQTRLPWRPEIGVILGSGLGNFTREMQIEGEIDYADIPQFPVSTVDGHSGKLIFGTVSGRRVVVMAGRFHFYEGYTVTEVVIPVRVLKYLGIEYLLISNAAGGVHPDFEVGDLMIIHDHISFATINPLIGPNIEEWGSRFPDMSEPYRKHLVELGKKIAKENKLKVHTGIYFGVTGPSFETRAEYRMIRMVGADAVGMSTVQEVITANHMGIPVFAVSVITDLGIREEANVISHLEVLEAAAQAEPKLSLLFRELIRAL